MLPKRLDSIKISTRELVLNDLLVWGSFWVTIRMTFLCTQEKHIKRLVRDMKVKNNT